VKASYHRSTISNIWKVSYGLFYFERLIFLPFKIFPQYCLRECTDSFTVTIDVQMLSHIFCSSATRIIVISSLK